MTDVTYDILHSSMRFYNAEIVSVGSGTFSGVEAVVTPGSSVRVKANWQRGPITDLSYCSGCIVQSYVAWFSDASDKGATPPSLGLLSQTHYQLDPNPGPSGTFDWTTNAPNAPGIYYIGHGLTLHYNFQPLAFGNWGRSTAFLGTPAVSFKITIPDPTPPVIAPNVSGTVGNNGWYTSNVDVSWTVTDPETAITSSTGCGPTALSTDDASETYTCTAASLTLSASASVTVQRDATPPSVSYSGNAGSYDAAASVNITCSASDAMSGVASDTCAAVAGPAYTFGLGSNTFSASATDNAGNSGSGSTSFTVTASFAGACSLAQSFADKAGIGNSLCAKLRSAENAKNADKRQNILGVFINEVAAHSGKNLTAAEAAILTALANALM